MPRSTGPSTAKDGKGRLLLRRCSLSLITFWLMALDKVSMLDVWDMLRMVRP